MLLRTRELGHPAPIPPNLVDWVEAHTLRNLDHGHYVTLDKTPLQVRSTISIAFSHDGKYFASTHGDHTVKVFQYPQGNQIACLEGHPRTPWTVRFHPSDSSILASGCLGSDCRVWDITHRVCIRKHHFRTSISCVSFSPDGNLLAVTSGKTLQLWDYRSDTRHAPGVPPSQWDPSPPQGVPLKILEGTNPFHMVDFHPSGTMLMTGEKNRYLPPSRAPNSQDDHQQQFTLKLVIYRFEGRILRKNADPILEIPRAVAYNDAGIHFSPCGTMLAACVPADSPSSFQIAVHSLVSRPGAPVGTILYKTPLDRGHVTALTNLKFSPNSSHLLAGFSFRSTNPVLTHLVEAHDAAAAAAAARGDPPSNVNPVAQVRVVDIYKVGQHFEMIRSLHADMDFSEGPVVGTEDEINVAVFAPVSHIADGVVYGTQKGRIRMFRPASGRITKPAASRCPAASDDMRVPDAAAVEQPESQDAGAAVGAAAAAAATAAATTAAAATSGDRDARRRPAVGSMVRGSRSISRTLLSRARLMNSAEGGGGGGGGGSNTRSLSSRFNSV